ncbi:arf-GAP with Rho-GAP domain, ANK repeat and PH domain-containing protein 1-like isoform X2 [Amphiura filiformis]|uniref:arf-GAP with Rho-GAP domain, ANK repeat and PH domain-containing protein 1-like isoform X2 n=1 Tax=Amphiura filiformis TaxID=82378 RepID=UPI003B21A48D
MLINSDPVPATTAFNPFNPFNSSYSDPSQYQDLAKRPVPQPPQDIPVSTVTTLPQSSPPLEELFKRPVPQPQLQMMWNPFPPPPSPPVTTESHNRPCPDGSPATSPNNFHYSDDDELDFDYPPPPPPRPSVPLQNRSPPPPPPSLNEDPLLNRSPPPPPPTSDEVPLQNRSPPPIPPPLDDAPHQNRSPPPLPPTVDDIPPPEEDHEEFPEPPPPTVPPYLELLDSITSHDLADREPPPPPPSQQEADASLMQRFIQTRPVPEPPTIPPRGGPPPVPPSKLHTSQNQSDPALDHQSESDLIDMNTPPVVESESTFESSKEDSLEEISSKYKLSQSFDDSQSLRSKDSPDSGLGFLHDNQSDHSHHSDQSSHHSDHSLAKQDSVESIPPQLPPKSSLSSQSLSSRSSQSISSNGSQTSNTHPPLEKKLSLETDVPFVGTVLKNDESLDESEYDFLRDASTRPLSDVYFPLSEAESRPLSSEVEYISLADSETRPVSIFGQPRTAPPLPPNTKYHRQVPRSPDPQDTRASYLKLSDATSGGLYDVPSAKSLPPIPSARSNQPTFAEEPTPLIPSRRAPPPPPGRTGTPTSKQMLQMHGGPLPKYAHVNKMVEGNSQPLLSSSPTSPPNIDDDEYDELRIDDVPERPAHHGSFSSFRELAQSEDSESEAEILDEDEEVDGDSLPGLGSAEFRSNLEAQLKRRPGLPKRNRESKHSRSIDDIEDTTSQQEQTRKRLDATLSRIHQAFTHDDMQVIEKSGFLWKQGGAQGNRGFRKRWVVFKNNELRYYENDKTMNETKKIVPVGAMRDVQNLCGIAKFNDSKPNRIVLDTIGRTFQFAAETCDEGTLWANILMKAILLYEPPPGGYPVGGDMSCPDKAGYLKMEGCSQKRYLAIKGEMMCYYNSRADFESAIPVGDIPMKLASVKDLGKNKLQLFTPSKSYVLTGDSPQEVKEWMEAMKEAIAEGLSDHTVISKVWKNPDNKFCAECGMPDPDWASINFVVVVCKQCSGFHRELGVHMSKVRSLKMDVKVWTDDLIQLMLDLGNIRANAYWEASLPREEKPVPDADRDTRQLFLQKKYKAQLYAAQLKYDQATLDKKLLKAANENRLEDCMRLLYSGADLTYTGEDGKDAHTIAKSHGYNALAEFLQQNSGYTSKNTKLPDGGSPPKPKEDWQLVCTHTTRDSKQEGIHKSGYLFKTGSNRREFGASVHLQRDFLRRFCVLEHGILTYYLDEKVSKSMQHDVYKASYSPQLLEQTTTQQNCIEGIEMVLVALSEPKAGHKYCFEVVTTYGRAFLFAAETEIERREWMMALAKIHSIDSMWQSLQKFQFAGFLHKKDGAATTNWQRLWFVLKGKYLMFYSVANDSIDEIDLRKVVTLSTELPFMGNLASTLYLSSQDNTLSTTAGRQEGSDRNSTSEFNQYISVVLPGKIVYLRAETKQASDAWFGALQKAAAHKGPALDQQQLTGENVPIIVSECIKFVATHDGLTTEGIYRLSGTSSIISKLVNMFAEDPRGVRLNPEDYTIHDVTGALKKYFRELPDPLMTQKLYKEWIDKAGETIKPNKKCQDHDTKLQWYHYLLREMPSINYDTLKVLIGHLSSVSAYATENKMYTKNLAAVFGPTLMASSDQSFHNTDKEIKVIADLIDYYTWLFGVSDEEITKERDKEEKYRDGLAKLKEAQQAARRSEMDMDLLVEMFIGSKETGQSINIKLNRSQTADEILNQVVAQQQMPGDNWALVEKISNGELERLFHGYERVLVDIMAWNPQIAAGNYVCIKENPLQPHISLYIKSMHAWNGFLKYCDGVTRKWKRYHFDLSSNVLNYYRDNKSNSNPLGGWKVAELKIYMGVEKKKQPPTEWGISFTVGAEHTIRAICFERQDDLYMWLGGLLKSKIVDPSLLTYSQANLPPTPTRDSKHRRSKIPKFPLNWRKSRMPSIDDG